MTDEKTANLNLGDIDYEMGTIVGTEREVGLDVRKLRANTSLITYDPGYGNTGSCSSAITFIDGEKGILRYRGYPIEQVAEAASFAEVCYLLESPFSERYEHGCRPTVRGRRAAGRTGWQPVGRRYVRGGGPASGGRRRAADGPVRP